MGFLRLFLALIVFIGHFANVQKFDTVISGALAVRVFYLISGFYIQLILARYDDHTHFKRNFYASRLLRLYPTYFLTLLLTMWWNGSACNTYCVSMVINGSTASLAFYLLSNVLIIGQGVSKFLSYHYSNGGFTFDPNLARPNYWVSNMMILSQAWSIALELCFYLCAPFLLKRRSSVLTIITLCSFALKITLAAYGYNNPNTWYNAFFPSELHTFLLGALAVRIVTTPSLWDRFFKYLALGGLALLFTWSMSGGMHIPDPDELFILAAFCLLPFIFIATRHSRLDRQIGELSYPVYLNHFLAIGFVGLYIHHPIYQLIGSIILSLVVSVFTVWLIERPVSVFRHNKFRVS